MRGIRGRVSMCRVHTITVGNQWDTFPPPHSSIEFSILFEYDPFGGVVDVL